MNFLLRYPHAPIASVCSLGSRKMGAGIKRKLSGYVCRYLQDESKGVEDVDALYSHYPREALAGRKFYNVGAGKFHHPYWTNIDYSLDHYANEQTAPFINLNLMDEPDLPIESGSAELFFTSHVIEHFTTAVVEKMFSEAYRALKPGGMFRIVCPDADLIYNTLKFSRLDYWHWRFGVFAKYTDNLDQITVEDFVVKEIATERNRFFAVDREKVLTPEIIRQQFQQLDKTDFLNFLISQSQYSEERPHWHINWWNEEKIRALLQKVGFSDVVISGFDRSLAAPFHDSALFDSRCTRMSIYIEAFK